MRDDSKPFVAVAMPSYGNITPGAARAFYAFPSNRRKVSFQLMESSSSLLNHCFNTLWCSALNMRAQGITHFAMIHSDVEPEAFWLDTLYDEMQKSKADVISAVIPIKDERGITSTAVDTGDLFDPRRLTMREVMQLPPTFTAKDAGGPLLLNTGLWLCDFTKPWASDVFFHTLHRTILEDGQWKPQVVSEDWYFSDQLNKRGLRLAATRTVKVTHIGTGEYRNDQAWGKWATDEACSGWMSQSEDEECESDLCATQ